jgi:hypothetical protein
MELLFAEPSAQGLVDDGWDGGVVASLQLHEGPIPCPRAARKLKFQSNSERTRCRSLKSCGGYNQPP